MRPRPLLAGRLQGPRARRLVLRPGREVPCVSPLRAGATTDQRAASTASAELTSTPRPCSTKIDLTTPSSRIAA